MSTRSDEMKLKIVYRKNLKMTPGKLAAQAVHAAVGLGCNDPMITVVILGLSDKKYTEVTNAQNIIFRHRDAGYTEVEPGTETCAAFYEKSK